MKKASRSYRVIIDSNIWISFLIGKHLHGLQNHIDSQRIRIITCKEQIYELSEVFKKSEIKKYFSKDQIFEFFELLDDCSEYFEILTKTDICRDSKDNYLVSLAIDSKADFLVTGDNDLLELIKIGETIILKFRDFDDLTKY